MSDWIVTLTNGRDIVVEVPHDYRADSEHIDARRAEYMARASGAVTFAARPAGCTGISYRAHVGRHCPIHPEA